MNSNSEINAMTPVYIAKLGLKVQPTNFATQQIDDSTFKIFDMVIASFQMKDQPKKNGFFKKLSWQPTLI